MAITRREPAREQHAPARIYRSGVAASSALLASSRKPRSSAPLPRTRPARAADLPALAAILERGSREEPSFAWRSPRRDAWPADFAAHCRRKVRDWWREGVLRVAEIDAAVGVGDAVRDEDGGGGHRRTRSGAQREPPRRRSAVVAFAVWERCLENSTSAVVAAAAAAGSLLRRDADPARVRAFKAAYAAAKVTLFDAHPDLMGRHPPTERRAAAAVATASTSATGGGRPPPTRGYMFLKVLICDPAWRRRGAGTSLVRWGVGVARREGWSSAARREGGDGGRRRRRRGMEAAEGSTAVVMGGAALFASPMGLPLYRKEGFREVGEMKAEVEGDDEVLVLQGMVLVLDGGEGKQGAAED